MDIDVLAAKESFQNGWIGILQIFEYCAERMAVTELGMYLIIIIIIIIVLVSAVWRADLLYLIAVLIVGRECWLSIVAIAAVISAIIFGNMIFQRGIGIDSIIQQKLYLMLRTI